MHTWDNVALSGGGDGLGFLHPGGGMDRHAPVAPSADLHVLGRQLDDVLFPRVGVGDGVDGAVRELHLSINNKRVNQGYGTYGKDACCWDDYIWDVAMKNLSLEVFVWKGLISGFWVGGASCHS